MAKKLELTEEEEEFVEQTDLAHWDYEDFYQLYFDQLTQEEIAEHKEKFKKWKKENAA
jgi:hypothetical protein